MHLTLSPFGQISQRQFPVVTRCRFDLPAALYFHWPLTKQRYIPRDVNLCVAGAYAWAEEDRAKPDDRPIGLATPLLLAWVCSKEYDPERAQGFAKTPPMCA